MFCTRTPIKAITLIIGIASGTLALTGCEWDNSEDLKANQTQEQGNSDAGSGTPGATEGTIEPAVSGVVATSANIEGSIICLDQDNNGVCGPDEPQTTSNAEGQWSITLEDGKPLERPTNVLAQNDSPNTVITSSGESVPWQFALSRRVEPTGDPIEGVLISLISTLVENNRQSLPSRSQTIAVQNLTGKIGTDVDILQNYFDPPLSATVLEDRAFARLTRIARVADALAIDIDAAVPDANRDNLAKKELDSRIFDKVSDALFRISQDVDQSLIETPDDANFDPVVVIQQPKYDDDRESPPTEPPSPSLTELEKRIASASNNSPYFVKSGFETFPVSGSRLYDFEFFDNPLRPGQVYYETRQRIVVGTDGDEALLDLDVAVPRRTDLDDPTIFFQKITEADCTNNSFDCTLLRSEPETTRALTWTGFSFATETIQIGHKGRQRALAISNLGDVVASSPNNGYSSEMNFREFSLQGLDGRDVIYELTGIEFPGTESWTYGTNAKAYTFSESLVSDIILSQWPAGGTGNLCDSPGMPDASETSSCNLVYGHIGQTTGMPAQSFAEALYPIAEQGTTYNSILEGGEPVDAMRLTGRTNDVFVARLFGDASNDSGPIVIDRRTDNGWQTLNVTGQWQRNQAPFPRIELKLPDGLAYADAKLGYSLGEAYLYERLGYLRHGWEIPKETNVDSLFDRRQVRFAFNQQAFDNMINALDTADILVEHPYYSAILDEKQAQRDAQQTAP